MAKGKRNNSSVPIVIIIVIAVVLSFLITRGIIKIPGLNFTETTTTNEEQTTSFQTTEKQTIVTPVEGEYLKVHFIDVGQGDCILIENVSMGEKEFMLVDAGTSAGHTHDVILDYLDSVGVNKLEYMILTHPHSDHVAGADNVIKKVEVEKVFIPDCEYDTTVWNKVLTTIDERPNIDVEFVDKDIVGRTYNFGKAEFTILWPENPSVVSEDDINEVSIVIRLVYGEKSFMLTGDAESNNEKAIVNNNKNTSLQCDVLKAGHHGSNTASCEEFLNAVKPEYVIISCGKDNKYGHPHKEPMERYEKMGCTILRTDLLGTIVLVTDGKEINIQE